jgi:hypothetical protein
MTTLSNTLVTAAILVALSPSAWAAPKLLDAEFADAMCKGWNQTNLPKALGRKGSGWIDSAGSKGKQVVVVNRRDCKAWQPIELVIEADSAGNATCVYGGKRTAAKIQWKFEPTTEQWADFTDGFGVFKMPGIMPGFVGPYTTAMNNIGNFQVFFAMAGYLARKLKVDWQCKGADAEDVKEEIADIDLSDMRSILKGAAILK